MITVLNDINDFTKIVTANHNVLVDFNATWCGPCRIMGRIIEEIKDDYSDIVFLKVDTDDFGEIAQQFGVMSIPTMIAFQDGKRKYFMVDGEQQEVLIGSTTQDYFEDVLNNTFRK